jgi:hypothetical protein
LLEINFDPDKNEKNILNRGLSFQEAKNFDFENAAFWVDDRHDYGETRYVAIGCLSGRLHVLCFTETQAGIRVISFRKANSREVKRYEKT